MSRVREYLDHDVLTAARQRMNHVLDTFDSVIVAFSGGKDSTVCLLLLQEVMEARGDTRPVRALFRDEEVIPDEVIDYVTGYRDRPWLDLRWYAVPLANTKSVLGRVVTYSAFDPERPVWVRQPPPWAIRTIDGWPADHVFSQYDSDEAMAGHLPGKVAVITGVRAAESLVRYRSCVNKMSENYIVACAFKRANLVRPIFDWEEDDVFRYFYDRGEPYCPLYDQQIWTGHRLRVGTPLTSEGAKTFHKVAAQTPGFHDRILAAFPDYAIQERYGREVDTKAAREQYGQSLQGVRAWVLEHLGEDPAQLRKALAELASITARTKNDPRGYPPRYVLQTFMAGRYKRVVPPCGNPEAFA